MASSEVAITNLLYRYAECVDTGDFKTMAELFAHAQMRTRLDNGEIGMLDGPSVASNMSQQVVIYPDGTPRTKHVTTNAIVEVDEDAGVADARSYYTVFQQLDDFPLQAIITGHYVDRFERVDGEWRWAFRDYSFVDQIGDLSRHLKMTL
jgi:3-phenylpropionate/cinnamic acid dioxygenase small subunit